MTMTTVDRMVMDFAGIRRYATNKETPAAVPLIEANLHEREMTAYILCRICPLTHDDAEYILSLSKIGDKDEWESVPEHDDVDYAYCDGVEDAQRTAFAQLLHAACVRVVDAIDNP